MRYRQDGKNVYEASVLQLFKYLVFGSLTSNILRRKWFCKETLGSVENKLHLIFAEFLSS